MRLSLPLVFTAFHALLLTSCTTTTPPGDGDGDSPGDGDSSGDGDLGGDGDVAGDGDAPGDGDGDGDGDVTSVPGAYATATIITTSKDGDKLTATSGTIIQDGGSVAPNIAVDPAERQTVIGFGTSLTESAARVLDTLSPTDRQATIDAMFKPHPEGANYTLTRLPMASCDFSTGNYTYAPTETENLSDFSIDVDKDDIIPLTLDAMAATGNELKVMSSPWTPPPWMKNGPFEDEAGFVGGSFNMEYASIYADYFLKYVQAYEAEGIPIWSLTPQNEPEHVGNFETCGFSAGAMATFLGTHLGPKLEAAGYGDILLMGFDHNKGTSLTSYAHTIYADPNAYQYTDGMAHHWYGSTNNYGEDSLAEVSAAYPDKLLVASEQSVDNFEGVSGDAWQNDTWWWEVGAQDWCDHSWCPDPQNHPYYEAVNRYAKDIILDFNNGNHAWISWNAALFENGHPNWYGVTCSADVMIGQDDGTIYFPPTFYAVQQFSRYLRPGAKIHASSGAAAGLMSLAGVNEDGSLAVVVFNESAAPVTYQASYMGQAVEATVPGPGIQTIEFK